MSERSINRRKNQSIPLINRDLPVNPSYVSEIKKALGVENVYSESSSFRMNGQDGFQIDLIIDRKDQVINLCECKFYEAPFELTKKYATELMTRKSNFKMASKTSKSVFNTLITNQLIKENAYSLEAIDLKINLSDIM